MNKFLFLSLLALNVQATEIPRNPDGSIVRSTRVLASFQRAIPCPTSNSTTGSCKGYVKDHIIPLCAGGYDTTQNLKWSEYNYSKLRDREEVALCHSLKRHYGDVTLGMPVSELCEIIKSEKLTMLQEICK